jgi:hypothetical protein
MATYLHPYFSVHHFRLAYVGVIKTLPEKSQWPHVDIGFKLLPPLTKRDVGRHALFAWLISHQPAVLFSHNKSATSNQPAILFSQKNQHQPSATSQPNRLEGRTRFLAV